MPDGGAYVGFGKLDRATVFNLPNCPTLRKNDGHGQACGERQFLEIALSRYRHLELYSTFA
ncbi:hypothetical protein EMEDMD4_1250003 [Sinorhizobium medicae]|uniref:Uncharacterized protein n=1 Tax=Sinorhizobium medicae TaxID=110321 RepID=A0A508WQT0_9HYPH|nr:hypothetical protein EMEDMD4_1250003 [Sinorhizobium medicae]